MAVPALKLNLAPPSNTWRSNHVLLGWAALGLGCLILAGSLGFTWRAYQEAARAGKLAGNLNSKTRSTADTQTQILTELRSVDVAKELPRWRLAERIYTERSLPWSRLTSELERSLVQDVRIKSIQRNRGTDMKVQIKLKGEARSREAEADFVESLQKNPFFDQVILEREGERQGGGVDFDYTLAAVTNPPPYKPLPKFAPQAKAKPGVIPQKAGAAPQSRTPAQPNGIAVPPARTPAQSNGIAVPPARTPAVPAPYGTQAAPPIPSGQSYPPPGSTFTTPPRRPGRFRPPSQEGNE
jgi:hypothetical protein